MRRTLLIPALLDDWFPLLRHAFASREWEPVLLREERGLADRGLIKPGMKADLVLFDFDEIEDTPSFAKPQQPCKGIRRVYVNGVLTALDGVHTGARSGRILRKGRM